MFADTSIDIKSVFPINDAMMQVNYETKESYIPDSRKQCPIINAQVCAKSRIYLYKAIQAVRSWGIDIAYLDTDRLILLKPNTVTDIGNSPCYSLQTWFDGQLIFPLYFLGIFCSNSIFGAWKSEVEPGLYIKRFFGLR